MSQTSIVSVATSGFLPPELVNIIKSEAHTLLREHRTRTFSVEYRSDDGILIEARLRTRERVVIVPLTT
jgi:hypothetical protein